MDQTAPKTIDDYIAGFPPEVQGILENIRRTVRKAAPEAKETIKYDMPAFTLNGNLVYFAAFQKHIGFYSVPTGVKEFEKDLAPYQQGSGSVQFQLDEPIPYGLISKIVKYRARENLARSKAKSEAYKARRV